MGEAPPACGCPALHMRTVVLLPSGHLFGTSAVLSGCEAVWLASCSLYSFSLTEAQLIGPQISLPRNLRLSVRAQPAGFGASRDGVVSSP